jgi:hypothetical protein
VLDEAPPGSPMHRAAAAALAGAREARFAYARRGSSR